MDLNEKKSDTFQGLISTSVSNFVLSYVLKWPKEKDDQFSFLSANQMIVSAPLICTVGVICSFINHNHIFDEVSICLFWNGEEVLKYLDLLLKVLD